MNKTGKVKNKMSNLRNWWSLNMRKPCGQLDTSRVANFMALWVLGAFFFFLITIYMRSAIRVLFTGALMISVDELQTLAYSAGVVVSSVAIPILNYRVKEYLANK